MVSCSKCYQNLESAPLEGFQRRQVFDIPQPRVEVTEHQAEIKTCSCGQRCVGLFPSDVTAPVQYGNRVKTLCVYLNHQQMIPEDRVVEVMEDIFALGITSATVVGAGEKIAATLLPWQEKVEQQLASAPVKNLDETGLRVEKKTQWLHVMSNNDATVYRIAQKRGTMFLGLSGIIIHDCFKSYYALTGVQHALCNAHILRELKALTEFEKESWAWKMATLLCFGNKNREQKDKERIYRLYDLVVAQGLSYHENQKPLDRGKRGRQKKRIGHNLLIRLKDHKTDILRFLSNPLVAFTNNLAEQDLRMMKVKMKISGGFRTMHGAQTFCTIRSFTSTCRKQGINIFRALADAHLNVLPAILLAKHQTLPHAA